MLIFIENGTQWYNGFKRVGLSTNVSKMVFMVFHPGLVSSRRSKIVYGCQMAIEGYSHRLRQILQVVFTKCGADLEFSSLASHIETQHSQLGRSTAAIAPALLPASSVEYGVSFPCTAPSINCPVTERPGRSTNCLNLHMHFMCR